MYYLHFVNFQMQMYFDRYLQQILDYKRNNCEEPVPICELNGVISLCNLLECFATKQNGVDPENADDFDTMSKLWFLFW